MKTIKVLFTVQVIAAVIAGCASDNKSTNAKIAKSKAPKVVTGDFNGDGKVETATLIAPKLSADGTTCIDSTCTAVIKFSDTTIHPIRVKSCIGGTPDNLGDLNGDGKDELGLLPEWFASCWRNYHVYTYNDGEWINAVPYIPTHCNQWEANVKPIEKDSLNKGYVVIHYSEFVNKEIKTMSKIESIK